MRMVLSSVDADTAGEVEAEVVANEIYELLSTARDVKEALLRGEVPEGCTERTRREILETDLDRPTVSLLTTTSGKVVLEVR